MAIPLHSLCIVLLVFLCPSPSHGSMPMIRCISHESEALLSFKEALNDTDGILDSWVNGTDCCTDWYALSCDNHIDHIVSISFEQLDLEDSYLTFKGVMSKSLCQLRFLTSFSMSGLLPPGSTIPSCLGNLSHLYYLGISANFLSGMIPPSICFLTSLRALDLSANDFNGSIPSCIGNLTALTELDLSVSHRSGIIPASLGNLTLLREISLYGNQLSGFIPASLGSLTLLREIRLWGNQLSGFIPASLGSLTLLKELYLDDNQLSGIIPDSLGNLSLLETFSISNNQLSGTIPPSFAQLSSLVEFLADGNGFNETISSSPLPPSLVQLELSMNHYQPISETLFHNLTSLNHLHLSNCVLNISTTWMPPFQFSYLYLVSCTIAGQFPSWISTQFSLGELEVCNAGLVGTIPSWLLETSPLLTSLNLSGNHLEGPFDLLDVSRNGLSGHIPSMWPSTVWILMFNDNLFSGNIPSSLGNLSDLKILNLANNNITGVIPISLSNCSSLVVLNLGNNSLEGRLPHEFSKLSGLYSLVVHNNKLCGPFPPPIANCSNLQVLDIGNNLFEGEIPTLLGNLSELRVLVMKENNFTGSIPSEIGHLMNLQILLLSSNHISGLIPHTIISLQAMVNETQNGFVLSDDSSGQLYQDGLDMTVKGTDQHYQYILSTLISIDLSNNKLEGNVPSNLGNLKGLRLLNLSMNSLNGSIPKSLGEMHQLESLDLSRNHFSGQVPGELEPLSYLGSLNLSNNNLSGSIPQGRHMTGTFGESSYSGNPNLWGCPLPRNCSWPEYAPPPPPVSINKIVEGSKYPWYEIALGLSYGIAFGGIISLIVIKINWRKKYFSKVDAILKFVFPWMKNLTL